MADKDFRVKNRLHVNGLSQTSGVILATNNALDSHTNVPTQYGGTGTTISPSSGQILYSSSGTTYSPTTLSSLDVKGATYSADAPASPFVGQVWIESDSSSDSFDPNIIRRKSFTATAGQTTFTADLAFIQGYEQVFFNGMLLVRNDDYMTPTNTSVLLNSAAAAGDIVEIVSITNLNSINAATTTTNTFTGNQIISGSASLGIGTSNPLNNIHIYRSSGNAVIRSESAGLTGDDSGALNLIGGPYSLQNIMYGAGGAYTISNGNAHYIGTTSSSPLVFWTNATEKMRIDSSGNVGIGTTAVINGAKLNVGGRIRLGSGTSSGDSELVLLNNDSATPGWMLSVRTDIGGSNNNLKLVRLSNSGAYLGIDLVVDKTGKVGIATTDPRAQLEVAGDILQSWGDWKIGAQFQDGTGYFQGIGNTTTSRSLNIVSYAVDNSSIIRFYQGSNQGGTERARFESTNGYFLIGYTGTNGAYRLQVNSQIFATSSSIATSDGRYKENVETITSGLDIIDSLRPVAFDWKEHAVHNFPEGKTVGFIAQEVQDALSGYEWVDNIIKSNYNEEADEEFLGIAESNIIPLLVAAVKELKARVETLEANQ